jgi:hypothetical protein
MKRILIACVAVGLSTMAASAASPQIDAAIKTLTALGDDPAKLQTFCALNKVMQALGDKQDPAAEKQIEAYFDQLGDEFEAAWTAGEGLDENSPDGKEYAAALEALEDKCP